MGKKIFLLTIVFLITSCGTQKIITQKDLLYKSTIENLDKFGTFIWSKNKNDSIVINKKNLNIIKLKKGIYFKSLFKYTDFLTSSRYDIKSINFSEKSKIIAYLINYIKQNNLETKIIEYTILNDEDLQYYNEFERNNYYSLPNFKSEYQKKIEELEPPIKTEVKPSVIIIQKID